MGDCGLAIFADSHTGVASDIPDGNLIAMDYMEVTFRRIYVAADVSTNTDIDVALVLLSCRFAL